MHVRSFCLTFVLPSLAALALPPARFAVNPDLSAFRARGGRLLLAHGWSDPALSAPGRTQNDRMNLALFDFDGTLTSGDTLIPFLRFAIPPRRRAASSCFDAVQYGTALPSRRD